MGIAGVFDLCFLIHDAFEIVMFLAVGQWRVHFAVCIYHPVNGKGATDSRRDLFYLHLRKSPMPRLLFSLY